MKKTFPIVMLPTEKASLFLHKGADLCYNTSGERSKTEFCQPYHLYILSDEQPKEGDWVIVDGKVKQVTSIQRIEDWKTIRCNNSKSKDDLHSINQAKKIAATTDTTLLVGNSNNPLENYFIPQLDESFIQAYIKAYNEGKPITEVDLEVDDNYLHNESNKDFLNNSRIKTRPDNTVIIKEYR